MIMMSEFIRRNTRFTCIINRQNDKCTYNSKTIFGDFCRRRGECQIKLSTPCPYCSEPISIFQIFFNGLIPLFFKCPKCKKYSIAGAGRKIIIALNILLTLGIIVGIIVTVIIREPLKIHKREIFLSIIQCLAAIGFIDIITGFIVVKWSGLVRRAESVSDSEGPENKPMEEPEE